MIRLYTLYLLTCILFSCTPNDNDRPTPSGSNKEVKLTNPEDIIGQWRFVNNYDIYCSWEEEEDYAQEWTYMYMPDRSDIIFTADSCYRVDFPVELKEGSSYKIDPLMLDVNGSLGKSRYIVRDDTLHLYRYDEWNFIKQTFKRVEPNDSIFNLLKKDTVNYADLAGTWHILWEWGTGMDDGSYYTLNFPHKIPDSVMLTREQILATCYTDKSMWMLTDGKKRPYTYGYRSYRDFWDRDISEFYLVPGAWYTGDSVEIHLEQWDW